MTNKKINIIIKEVTKTETFTIKEYLLYQEKYSIEENNNSLSVMEDSAEYEYNNGKINNIEDKIFRKLLENKKNAVQIINRFLDKEDRIKPKDIEIYNTSFVSKEFKNQEADIVYKLKDEEGDVFFHIEHQSKIDYMMAYRILKYELAIYESILTNKKKKGKDFKFPLIKPIVIYTGDKKWNAKTDLKQLQYKWRKYQNGIELSMFNVLDVNLIDGEELIKEKDTISKLMLIKKTKTEKELINNLIKISEEINKNIDLYTKDELELLKLEIVEILKKLFKDSDVNRIIQKYLKIEEVEKIMTVGDRIRLDRERTVKRAEKRGETRGKIEGRIEAKIEMIKNMLKEKLSIEVIETVSGLSKKEIEKIALK